MLKNVLLFLLMFGIISCSVKPKGQFSLEEIPAPPDYSNLTFWAAHPEKEDPADLTAPGLENQQTEAKADVFFLHPTIYTGKAGENEWNGPVDNQKLNQRVDEGTIQYQASIFNGVGRVYAPRYRQAHLNAYYTKKTASAEKAFTLAYKDVRAAFEYYLEYENNGRPIIIASHSQGTTHAVQLLKDFFDGTALQDQLVVAYLVGIAVLKEEFDSVPLCESPEQTQCFCAWRTWKQGKEPKKWVSPLVAVTNPLSWKPDTIPVPASQNQGAILQDFDERLTGIGDAQVNAELGILWTERPKIFAAIFLAGNYHVADFNLYYYNIRENVKRRLEAFW